MQSPRSTRIGRFLFLFVLGLFLSNLAVAQSLNWDGQTGAVITPFAYTAASPSKGFGHPIGSFHFMNGGPVVGNLFQASGTIGLFKRFEMGYSRTMTQNDPNSIFNHGYNTFHVKANVLPENFLKMKFMPAISVGFVARTNNRHGAISASTNGATDQSYDVYLVGTKTITQVPHLPILLSGGVKGTNSSILGIAGTTRDFEARAFGAAAVVLHGPFKSKFIAGGEALQESRYLKNLDYRALGSAAPVIPTTLNYFVRVLPLPEKPLNIDFAVLQAGGNISPALPNLEDRARFAMGISYKF